MDIDAGKMLGFGCMRMPHFNSDPTDIDYPKLNALIDEFMSRGFSYFDTAYTYHNYQAEKIVRRALVDRYPRESFQLATKLPLRDFKNAADMRRIFAEQLANCGVDHFDYYLLHNMGSNVYGKCEQHDAFGFLDEVRSSGKATFVGMSFHDTPKLLATILDKHAEQLDFLQLQVNYVDWEQPAVESEECLRLARRYGKPVIVMEPCKGGTLVNLPDQARSILKEADPQASTASWALRFAASQPGVIRVLSGMNEMEQVLDNCATFQSFRPIAEDELEAIWKARDIIEAQTAIACTACEYCAHTCPKQIPISKYFSLYNSNKRTTGYFSSQFVYYNNIVQAGSGKASDCIKCGVCEKACPQHLPIRELLSQVAEAFEQQAPPLKVTK